MISKELLSLVLGFPFASIQDTRIGNSMLEYTTYQLPTHKYKSINLDTLGRLCKEWCLLNGFQIESAININGGYAVVLYANSCAVIAYSILTVSTELEAIILATAWVTEQKKCYD